MEHDRASAELCIILAEEMYIDWEAEAQTGKSFDQLPLKQRYAWTVIAHKVTGIMAAVKNGALDKEADGHSN